MPSTTKQIIDLSRTFSRLKEEPDDHDDLAFSFGRGRDNFTWHDLHEKPITVVVGEAGIGKSIEFEKEAQRLRESGKKAFFIPLNQLDTGESWKLELEPYAPAYTQWQSSLEEGYFFLDAIDEARLTDPAAFRKALTISRANLRPYLSRVRIAISSRSTDWSIDEVRSTVEELLVTPIAAAHQEKARTETEFDFASDALTLLTVQPPDEGTIEPFVVTLEPLSRPEAHKLAEAWKVVDGPAFWAAVDDGEYDFMATRPLDLQWLVDLWNQKRSLGTYLELIKGNVTNRLTETNPSYVASGTVLSLEQLRQGAEGLAAAAVFTGRPFVASGAISSSNQNEVSPRMVLVEWSPLAISRLLASAVFDEGTYGRVKFHHRSAREYLAACWVNRQLQGGVPIHRLLPLFVASPFGESVLIPARRWTLCWLAAMNVGVREWVIRHFPEMFFFDGDPEAWDALSADQALLGYVQRLKEGLRTDWHNDMSEFRRIGRRVRSDRISALLSDSQLPAHVKMVLLSIVTHAHLTDCADEIFRIYQNQAASSREHQAALEALATVAPPEQRSTIKANLLTGSLTSNKLIAAALTASEWQNFTADELAKVFTMAGTEDSYGGGPMAMAINYDLLPSATAGSATLLLEAVVAMLPQPKEGQGFARHDESNQPDLAWLLDVLPNCFERLLTLLPPTLSEYPPVCLAAAERLEVLRDTGFTSRDEFSRLHGLIANHPKLRWQVGLTIAQSKGIPNSTSRLTWWDKRWCIVTFAAEDMPELITRANNVNTTPNKRDIWFTIAKDVAFRYLRGRQRKAALAALAAGSDGDTRTNALAEQREQFINGSMQRRSWKKEERQRKREELAKHLASRDNLLSGIQHIRDATANGFINWLVHYSYDHSVLHSFTRVDYGVIAKDFGQEIADALAAGLKAVWLSGGAPNPADYSNGSLPWEAITALAGLHTVLAEGLDIARLTGEEAARAARLAAWEANGPPPWLEPLTTTHEQEVCAALHPWICMEAQSETDNYRLRGALAMALRCPPTVRPLLLRPLVAMVKGGKMTRPDTTRAVVEALRKDGLIDRHTLADLCRAELVKSIGTDGLIQEMRWLRTWLEEDIHTAWTWFETHVAGLDATAGDLQVNAFVKTMADCNWVKIPSANDEPVEVLLGLHALLSRYFPPPPPGLPTEEEDSGFGSKIARLRVTIPRVLIQLRGASAHRALSGLAAEGVPPHVRIWLRTCIQEHASLEASYLAQIEASDLHTISSPFLSEPRNESQLFQQVVARLEEIKRCLEEGPFSDRDLFSSGMPEKKLQLWLAARFLDTQHRRFGVNRETVVDADKRTDIQLSARNWNVCVEIKPVDVERSYSANSLADTLQTQVVGQYLRGYNSSHGILVLFRLDEKTWDIPNGVRSQSFSALVSYLQGQAEIITMKFPRVEELLVVGIDCTVPKNLHRETSI